jgi:hypothetical protein
METILGAAWKSWLYAEARRRLMSACFVLDTQQSIYYEQLTTWSTFQQQAKFLPWLPCPEEVWDATSATIWAGRLSEHKATKYSIVVDDRLIASIIAEGQKLTPFSHLILVCTQFSEISDDPTYPKGFIPLSIPPALGRFMTTFPHDSKVNAFLMFYHTPLHDLLVIAGDTWVFGRKISSSSIFDAARSHLIMWSSSLGAATATQYACRIVQDEISQRFPRSAFPASNDQVGSLKGCISDYWVLYIAALVCWAFGHKYQSSSGGSISSRDSSSTSEPDSAIAVTPSSGYAEARAIEYLKKILEPSVEELLTPSFSARGDPGTILQVVKLHLEKEEEGRSSGMLTDAIGCLNKLAQGRRGKWF